MEAYLEVLVNFKQNNWVRLLSMAKFTYNNAKNASTSYTSFKLNNNYHPRVSFKEDINFCFKSKLADKLLAKLQKLVHICRKSIYYAQKLQKKTHNKSIQARYYALRDKV